MRRLVRIAVLAIAVAVVAVPVALALDIEEGQLPDAVVGTPYSFQLEGRAGCENSYHFLFDSGRIPPNLTVTDKGLLSGTPVEAGDFEFYVKLKDDCNSKPSEGRFTITVLRALVITTTALKPVRVGAPYSATLTASETDRVRWSVSQGSLPPGLALTENGSLSGTPTTAGSYTFTVKAIDAGEKRTATQSLTLVVAAPVAVAPPKIGPGEVGVKVNTKPEVTGGAAPFAWSVARGALPAGVSLDPATGAVSGTPGVAGSFAVTLGVADATGSSATVDLTFTIAPRLVITTERLAARVGHRYRAPLAHRGGVGRLRWKFGGTPPRDLRLNPTTGVLTGTPRSVGHRRLTITATDALGVKATRTLVLDVMP